jgi:hypothetical protein
VLSAATTNNVELYGFSGNDHFYAGTNSKVYGENGNDWLCVTTGQRVAEYWGGAGTDRYCGSVVFVDDASSQCPCQ